MTAPPFPPTPGWGHIANDTSINLINASLEGWRSSGDGIGFFLVVTALVVLIGGMIYIRSQKAFPAILGMLLATFMVDYYGLLDGLPRIARMQAITPIYICIIVLMGIALAMNYFNKD